MNAQLIRKAVTLFPRTEFSNVSAVRHARRQWLRCVVMLRCAPGGSKWILDQQVGRLQ